MLFNEVNSFPCCEANTATSTFRAVAKPRKELEQWQKDDAARLLKLWNNRPHPQISESDAGDKWGIGSQGAVWQYKTGYIPLNLKVLVKFAKHLKCKPSDISPTLAAQLAIVGDEADEQPSAETIKLAIAFERATPTTKMKIQQALEKEMKEREELMRTLFDKNAEVAKISTGKMKKFSKPTKPGGTK